MENTNANSSPLALAAAQHQQQQQQETAGALERGVRHFFLGRTISRGEMDWLKAGITKPDMPTQLTWDGVAERDAEGYKESFCRARDWYRGEQLKGFQQQIDHQNRGLAQQQQANLELSQRLSQVD